MMKCAKCSDGIPPDEAREHAGQKLCDDCYLDAVASPKTCDPWAVYTAKKTVNHNPILTETQQKILDILKGEGPISAGEICRQLRLEEEEFRSNFATLRHMELARGFKKDGGVLYTLFGDESC